VVIPGRSFVAKCRSDNRLSARKQDHRQGGSPEITSPRPGRPLPGDEILEEHVSFCFLDGNGSTLAKRRKISSTRPDVPSAGLL
jgi:hypothetical protein